MYITSYMNNVLLTTKHDLEKLKLTKNLEQKANPQFMCG